MAVLDSMDQATQARPLVAVAICGMPPAKVPPEANRTSAACVVSVRFATATSEHSMDTSAIRPLASDTGSWLLGAQLFRSPVRAGRENPLPVHRDTTGK